MLEQKIIIKKEQCDFEMIDGKKLIGEFYSKELNESLDTSPKGIIVIVHGMAEHRKRYEEFASFLADNDYIVYTYDQRGHGETAGSLDEVGYMSDIDNFKVLPEDVNKIIDLIQEKENYKDLPVFVLGHSMGSFVTQRFIELYSNKINGAILSGSNYLKSPLYSVGKFLAKMIVKSKGRRYRSKFLDNLSFGSYNKKFKPNRTEFDWLSENTENVDRYIADEYCGNLFTCSYFMDLLQGFKDISENVDTIRPDLPIMIISGQDDPVSNMGKGITKLDKCYHTHTIQDVQTKLYEHMRHEILNENNKEEVYQDVLDWINKHNQK